MQDLGITAAVAAVGNQQHLGRFSCSRNADAHDALVVLGLGQRHFPVLGLVGIQRIGHAGRDFHLVFGALRLAGLHARESGVIHQDLQFYGNRCLGQFQDRVIGKGNDYHIVRRCVHSDNGAGHFRYRFTHVRPGAVANLHVPLAVFHLELRGRGIDTVLTILSILAVGAVGTHFLSVHQQPFAVQRPVVVAVSVLFHAHDRAHAVFPGLAVLAVQDRLFRDVAVFVHQNQLIAGAVRELSSTLDEVFSIN